MRALFALLRNLLLAPLFPFWALARALRPGRAKWLHVRVRPRVVEVSRPEPPLARWVPALALARPTTLEGVRRFVKEALAAPEVVGVVVEIPPLASGWAACSALRRELVALRAGGKRVVVYLPRGGGNRELFVASAAERILSSRTAPLMPIGLSASRRHVRGLLDRLGVELEVYRRAEFKTAAEGLSAHAMSGPQREQVEALLRTIDGELVAALATRPGMDEAKVRALFETAALSGEAAVAAGLVDGIAYEDELPRVATGDEKAELVRADRWLARRVARFFWPVARRPVVAVVPIHGAIGDGGARGGREAVVSTLRHVAKDPLVAGVILHVESPGGSALASDLIHREVVLCAERKPVVAAFGEVAASGGYYVAAPAHAIVCEATSITGSIGVISARVVAERFLERLGVHTETVRLAPHADLLSSPRPSTAAEVALLERELDAFYKTFVGVVASGRRRDEKDVEPLARGRVWSGKDALERGLTDRLGGLDAARDEMRTRLGPTLARAADDLVVAWPKRGDVPPLEQKKRAALEALGVDPALAAILAPAASDGPLLTYAWGLPTIE